MTDVKNDPKTDPITAILARMEAKLDNALAKRAGHATTVPEEARRELARADEIEERAEQIIARERRIISGLGVEAGSTSDLSRSAAHHPEKSDSAWNPRTAYLYYRDGLRHAFHHAQRHHREGLEMLLRLAEGEGDELLTEILRQDLAQLGEL